MKRMKIRERKKERKDRVKELKMNNPKHFSLQN